MKRNFQFRSAKELGRRLLQFCLENNDTLPRSKSLIELPVRSVRKIFQTSRRESVLQSMRTVFPKSAPLFRGLGQPTLRGSQSARRTPVAGACADNAGTDAIGRHGHPTVVVGPIPPSYDLCPQSSSGTGAV